MENEISRIVESIRQENGIEAIYLFGSQATGRAKPYSDIDLCVVTARGADNASILGNSSARIDTSIFWDMPIGVRFRVMKEGKPLYIRDQSAMRRIEANTVLSYLDFKHVLDRRIRRMLA